MYGLNLLTLLLTIVSYRGGQTASRNLTFMFVTSFGQNGFNASGVIPGADLALEHINRNSTILPGYNLTYDQVRDSQISYASSSYALNDRSTYKRFYRLSLSSDIASGALGSILTHFGWTRLALLTQNEQLFEATQSNLVNHLNMNGITVMSMNFDSDEDPLLSTDDLFLEREDYHVFLLNCYAPAARRIICEAQKKGLTYPNYVWMVYDWFAVKWWTKDVSSVVVDCSDDELTEFVEGMLSLRQDFGLTKDDLVKPTDAGITPQAFRDQYDLRAKRQGFIPIVQGHRAYDVLWILALALNDTMNEIQIGDINVTHPECENVTGSLTSLENFTYSNAKMACILQENLHRTIFKGVTGLVEFNMNGSRLHQDRVTVLQYMSNGTILNKQTRAVLLGPNNFSFTYEPGISDNNVFPGGVPVDRKPIRITRTYKLWLVITYNIFVMFGLIFAVSCFMFNFIFRNTVAVKLSSPSLNYFIILGAVFMYLSVPFYILPSVDLTLNQVSCEVRYWLFTTGYSLIYGTILSKMWRVYQIFHNPTQNKKILKTWQLMIIIILLSGITVFLLFLGAVIPPLRREVVREQDSENPEGRTPQGVREINSVWICSKAASPNYFWQIFIFGYLIMLQIVGIILAFQTRKVRIKGLRDSKYVAALVYISSIVLVMLALITFSLRAYINISTGIIAGVIIILTTMFLALIFVPKMILLYHDPKGNTITMSTVMAVGSTIQKSQASELERKISIMEVSANEKDQTIAELRNENEALRRRITHLELEDSCQQYVYHK